MGSLAEARGQALRYLTPRDGSLRLSVFVCLSLSLPASAAAVVDTDISSVTAIASVGLCTPLPQASSVPSLSCSESWAYMWPDDPAQAWQFTEGKSRVGISTQAVLCQDGFKCGKEHVLSALLYQHASPALPSEPSWPTFCQGYYSHTN